MTASGVELAICGSNVTGDISFSCALRCGGVVDERRSPPGGRGDLAGLVDELCRAHGVRPAALTALRLDVGPGSYTGLRVAVTFVRFLQRFGELPVLAVDSLAVLAARAPAGAGRVHAVLDARRGRFHHGVFARDGERTLALGESAARPLPELLATLAAGDRAVLPAALAPTLTPALQQRGATVLLASAVAAAELFAAGLPFAPATAADLEPRYLMASYAEEP
ncbi:MAG: tRNA (adenosine(37)-N6)-threonylcarbamoyltransferase complex dimerization subunit type 1 TsaB [Planctomycetes bacterium]|nr:tRNA (adenosine(37)-N6)-threonylcarbamoyltransferase complex dimerization subunit type 1 TsaB [Planctomycetota bacterium]